MSNVEPPINNKAWETTKAVWINIIILVVVGIIAVIVMSIQFGNKEGSGSPNTFQVLGAAILIAGSSFTSGGLAGLLFGIPKLLQKENQVDNQTAIVQNDNLVEISDWLTKIIVGVGLTQLYQIPGFLGRIGRYFSPVFGNANDSKAAVICIILYFLALGFFALYLWTRLFFVRFLKTLNDQLQMENEQLKTELESTTSQLEQAKVALKDVKE